MSWEGAPACRWKKEYRKKAYRVSCKDLGFEHKLWTQEATYQAANDWWNKKLSELTLKAAEHPHQEIIDELESQIEIAAQHGLHDEVETLTQRIKFVREQPASDPPYLNESTAQRIKNLEDLLGIVVPKDLDPTTLESVFGREAIWNDRKRRLTRVPTESTVEGYVRKFLDFHKSQVKAKAKSAGRFGVLKNGVEHFQNWFGAKRALREISEGQVTEYYCHLMKRLELGEKGNSPNTILDRFQAFKQFVEFAAGESAEIALPKNLRSKRFQFNRTRREPNIFTRSEFELVFSRANERLQTYLLLMLNCGFYQGDLAELEAKEIDWKVGRIIRTRSKRTKMQAKQSRSTPIKINWILWDKTFEMLKRMGSRRGLVFLNENGEPIVRGGISEDDKVHRQDNVRSAYNRVIRKLIGKKLLPKGWNKTLKDLRKTGANVLEKSKEHAAFYEMFLNHGSVAKRHYLKSGEPVPLFDEAVKYIGDKMGYQTNRKTNSSET